MVVVNQRSSLAHTAPLRSYRKFPHGCCQRAKSAGQAQRFLAAHDQINNLFHLRCGHIAADQYRAARTQAFQTWAELIGAAALA